MSRDEQTIAVYDSGASDYARRFEQYVTDDPAFARFCKLLPVGGHVLDFGCGPGQYAATFAKAGFKVTATDASSEMVKLALQHGTFAVEQATFADLDAKAVYDGVWANFSLLHAPRADFSGHLKQIARALKQGGIVHLGMKTGEGEQRDRLGRRYCFYSALELHDLLSRTGVAVIGENDGQSAGFAGTVDPWIALTGRKV